MGLKNMKKNSLLVSSIGLVAGISSSLGFSQLKRKIKPLTSLPILYAGSWKYVDGTRNRTHTITISPKLNLTIDNQAIPANVEHITSQELTFVDKFGYRITVQTNQERPVKLIDEADDQAYNIEPL